MAHIIRGIHIPHNKNTAGMDAVRMPSPERVTIPMNMNIGAPAVPTVKAGDRVSIGQLIAEPGGFVSAPVHASVSGTVEEVCDFTDARGNTAKAVIIRSDGEMRVSETLAPPQIASYDEFLQAVRDSGLIGLGGAGFPAGVKLNVKELDKIDEVILNGAECEPYITTDAYTMERRGEDIFACIDMLIKYMKVGHVLIGIEENKPEAIAVMTELAASRPEVEVRTLPSSFPQGGEKVLIYNLTGKKVGEGQIPLDVGSIVMNVTSCAVIGEYIRTGKPLVERCVTVDGSAVKEPKNVIAPVGTSIRDIIEFAGGFSCDPYKVLYGGPMMGTAVNSLEAPLLKNNNAILALNEKDGRRPKETACLHCGKCVDNCPMSMNPPEIASALDRGDMEELRSLKPNLCIECGSCVFNCPARRDIVRKHREAKAALRSYIESLKAE